MTQYQRLRQHPPGWISPYERRQIQKALLQVPAPKVERKTNLMSLGRRITRADGRYERELLAAAYAEAARRRTEA